MDTARPSPDGRALMRELPSDPDELAVCKRLVLRAFRTGLRDAAVLGAARLADRRATAPVAVVAVLAAVGVAMKVFVTKYALTAGIYEEEVRPSRDGDEYVYGVGPYMPQYKLGSTCHHSRLEAQVAAEQMRDKKIASLKKQIAKLERMTFEAAA